jgi:hypothetical protein
VSDVSCMLLMHGMVALLHPVYKLCKALQCADSGLPDVTPLIETALQELQGLLLDNLPCTKEGSQEDVHPERAGSSCADRFANLVGNSRSGSAFDVVFFSPEHEDYPTIDVPYDDRGSAVAAMRVPSNRSDSGCVHCMLELRNRRGRVPVTKQACKQTVRTARLELASMAKVVIAAVDTRFPEGGVPTAVFGCAEDEQFIVGTGAWPYLSGEAGGGENEWNTAVV